MSTHGHAHHNTHLYRVTLLARKASVGGAFEFVVRDVRVASRDDAGQEAEAELRNHDYEVLHLHSIEGRLD